MNHDVDHDASDDAEKTLRMALIRYSGLSDEAIAKISHAARVLNIGFCEAAVNTGFVSQKDVEHARQSTHAPSVRVLKARPGPELQQTRQTDDTRAQNVLTLRTELMLRHESETRANMVALLSPAPGDGRSRLCADLALTFAQLGHPTLLVDADLRNPRQHILFEADNERGLSQAIAKREPPVMHTVEGLPHMSLLTAGPKPVNPLELLSDEHFHRLIRDWRNTYEFVVIDTSPVNSYSDGLVVSTLVGRVLLISRANRTRYRQQREMLRKLAVTRTQILGAVINYF